MELLEPGRRRHRLQNSDHLIFGSAFIKGINGLELKQRNNNKGQYSAKIYKVIIRNYSYATLTSHVKWVHGPDPINKMAIQSAWYYTPTDWTDSLGFTLWLGSLCYLADNFIGEKKCLFSTLFWRKKNNSNSRKSRHTLLSWPAFSN